MAWEKMLAVQASSLLTLNEMLSGF